MELPSLQKINPIFTNVYLQLNCSGTHYNYFFKSSPDLFFNSFNKATVNDFISHKWPLSLGIVRDMLVARNNSYHREIRTDRDETDFSFKFTVLYFRIFFPIKYMSLRETKWTAHIESRHWIKVGFETIRMQWSHLMQGLANQYYFGKEVCTREGAGNSDYAFSLYS